MYNFEFIKKSLMLYLMQINNKAIKLKKKKKDRSLPTS